MEQACRKIKSTTHFASRISELRVLHRRFEHRYDWLLSHVRAESSAAVPETASDGPDATRASRIGCSSLAHCLVMCWVNNKHGQWQVMSSRFAMRASHQGPSLAVSGTGRR